MIIFCTATFVSSKSIFSWIQISLTNCVFLVQNHQAFSKIGFSRKYFQTELTPVFSLKNNWLKWLFYSNWKQFQAFKIVLFEFKITVHYGLWAKCIRLWPLNEVNFERVALSQFLIAESSLFLPNLVCHLETLELDQTDTCAWFL